MGLGIIISGVFILRVKPNARFVAAWIAFTAVIYAIGNSFFLNFRLTYKIPDGKKFYGWRETIKYKYLVDEYKEKCVIYKIKVMKIRTVDGHFIFMGKRPDIFFSKSTDSEILNLW